MLLSLFGILACGEPNSDDTPDAGANTVDAKSSQSDVCNLDLIANEACSIMRNEHGEISADGNLICFQRRSFGDNCGYVFAEHFEEELCPVP